MQKTLTINGRRYTGKQIATICDNKNMTMGEDYIITIDGLRFLANYRQIQDSLCAPVCDPWEANALALMPCNSKYGYPYKYTIWISLSN